MTTTSMWISPVSGDWDDPDNWSNGVPDGTDADVQIQDASGVTITLSSAHTVDDLSITGDPGTVFSETTTGSLDFQSGFSVSDGATAILAGANVNQQGAGATVDNARLDLRNDQALGTMTVGLVDAAVVTCHGDITFGNAFDQEIDVLHDGSQKTTFSAAHGSDLTIAGALHFADQGVVAFGETAANGTVTLAPYQVRYLGAGGGQAMVIADGTLRIGNATGASMFEDSSGVAPTTVVDKGAVFDIHGIAVEISDLESNISYPVQMSDGRITNSAAAFADLTLGGGSFGGTIDGRINLAFAGSFDLYSAPAVRGSITVDGTLNLFTSGTLTQAVILAAGKLDHRGPYVGATGTETLSGLISGSGTIIQSSTSQLVLNHANTFTGSFETDFGVTTIANAHALGTASLRFVDGLLLSTVDAALSNNISCLGGGAIAASHGHTLTLSGALTSAASVDSLTFGAAGDDGAVVANLSGAGFRGGIAVAAGTLQFGQDSTVFAGDISTSLAAGATLDLAGHAVTVGGLGGAGAVVDSAAGPATLTLAHASFAGVISGHVAVEVASASTFTNANTYTGATTIDAGAILALGNGGKGGAVAGAIADGGRLIIDRSDAVTLSGAISGAGDLVQRGAGTTTLTGNNSFSGGLTVKAGELAITGASALGSGDVTVKGGILAVGASGQLGPGEVVLAGGELLAQSTLTLGGSFAFKGASTVAAAHGATLTLAGDQHVIDAAAVLHFGGGAADGTVVLAPSTAEADHNGYTIDIDLGVVRLGSPEAAVITGQAGLVNVAAGATLDIGGVPTSVEDVTGAGRITDTGGAGLLVVDTADLSGAVSGSLNLIVEGAATLSGPGSFTELEIGAGASATLGSTAAEEVYFQGGGTLVLAPSAKLTGAIDGFGSGATIDLERIAYGKTDKLTYSPNIGKLVVSDASHSVSLHFDGSYGKAEFGLSDDGHGGTLISFKAAAGAGHGIAAASGEEPLEHAHHHAHADCGLVV